MAAKRIISAQFRRGLLCFVLLLGSGATVYASSIWAARLPRFAYLSGWALFALILILTLYNGRKKLPFQLLRFKPQLSSRVWLQFHIYAGFFSGVLFLIHISYRIPTGWFEGTLAWVYALVMASGIFGLFLSSNMPRRLTNFGGEVLFERIPVLRFQCKTGAEALAFPGKGEAGSPAIGEFYLRHLRSFFDGPRHLWPHIFGSQRPRNVLLSKIEDLNRYLNSEERKVTDRLADIIREKDGLDYHYALQLLLKSWLFVHIPLTYSLLLFVLAHIILVFGFSGGAR